MKPLALFLLAAPVAAAPLFTLDHGTCPCRPSRQQLMAARPTPPNFDADAYLAVLAQQVDWIAARNAWRQRRADVRERARRQGRADAANSPRGSRDTGAGQGLFGLPGLLAGEGAGAPAAPAESSSQAAAAWFQVLPVDPATPGYAYTGSGGQQVGWRVHPVHGGERFHTGLDLGVDQGTPIHAIGDGKVVLASTGGGFGHWLILEHAGGVRTFYAHMAQPAKVRSGQVAAGQVVGYVGSTGISTAPHLHFEVWVPRGDLPDYAAAWVAQGAYAVDEAHMPGLGLIDPARLVDFARTGGTPSGEGAPARSLDRAAAD